MIWFTADPHYMHDAIIEYCNRPFKNSTVMTSKLVKNYNMVVKDEDTVYFVGDLSNKTATHTGSLANIFKRLNGTKHLILGNHDVLKPFSYINDLGFTSVHTSLEVEEFILNHDPAASIIVRDRTWLCGHIHDLFVCQKNVINVGVDVWEYFPVHIDSIREIAG